MAQKPEHMTQADWDELQRLRKESAEWEARMTESPEARIARLEQENAILRAQADGLAAALDEVLREWHEDATAPEIVDARAALAAYRQGK
jgi:predicted nuclease with TOPRIM domain